MNVLAYDYTGYGGSQGKCSEKACYAAIEAAFTYLTTVRKFQADTIFL